MQSNLNIGPTFNGRVRQLMVREARKVGYSLESGGLSCLGVKTNNRDDLVLAGIISVLKGSCHPGDFILNPDKATIVLKKLQEMTRKGYVQYVMPNTSKGVKFFRSGNSFKIVPVDAVPKQLALIYEFPESAAMFYNA